MSKPEKDIPIPNRLYGVIGWPLSQTMSPAIHNWGFVNYGLDNVYMAWPIEPGCLGDFVRSVRTLPISGVSVTIPHKETIIQYLDKISSQASELGAVNTLYWDEGLLCGENTDITGFMRPLKGLEIPSALVLGAGGAARAVLGGLKGLGVKKTYLSNRSVERGQSMAAEFNAEFVEWGERSGTAARLIVNSTPLGMKGKHADKTPYPAEKIRKDQIVYDLVYNPIKTQFLIDGEKAGAKIITGLEMFAAQAQAQFELWTGVSFDFQEGSKLIASMIK